MSSIDVHFRRSEAIFIAEVVKWYTLCPRSNNLHVLDRCGDDFVQIDPNYELTLKTVQLIKGADTPDSLRIGGCSFGGWSKTGKTLVFALTIKDGSYAFLIPEESANYKTALSRVRQLNRQK